MKKLTKLLALVLCLALCVGVMALSAFAAEAEQDGLKLTLTTDKEEYVTGDQILVTLKAQNVSAAPISNIALKVQVPEGLILAGTAQKTIASLEAGASDELNVTLNTQETDNPTTGDATNIVLLAVVAMVCCAAVVVMFANRKTACMILALVLVAGICLPAAAAMEAKSVEVILDVKVDGAKYELKATANWEAEAAPVMNTQVNADHFDLSKANDETGAVVKSNGMINSFAAFNGTASEYYVASATVKISNPDGGDTWSRVGISHWNGSNSYYGFQVSPGPNYGARKVVTMVITDGNVQWDTVTNRSQNWWQNNQGALDYNNIQLTAVRDGNTYYAFLNGKLWYVDQGMAGFDDIGTIPVLNVGSCEAEFTNMSVQYGQAKVAAFLETADSSKFYAADPDKTILNADGSITFNGAADQTSVLNAKDHAAKSVGCAMMLPAGVESTLEFDLKIDYFGARDGLPALAVTLNRYDEQANQARSLIIGQYKAGWTGWDSNGNLNEGIGDGGRAYSLNGEETRLEEGQTYHVKLVRFISGNGMDTKMVITDTDGNVILEYTWGWANDGYQGRVDIRFLNRDLDCTVSNIVIS